MKINFACLSFTSLTLICSNVNILCNNVNKIVLRITTDIPVFVTVPENSVLLIMMKFRESWSIFKLEGGG
jgi:hypothetical protein